MSLFGVFMILTISEEKPVLVDTAKKDQCQVRSAQGHAWPLRLLLVPLLLLVVIFVAADMARLSWFCAGKSFRFPQSIRSSTPFCLAWQGKLGWTLMLNSIIAITYTFTFLAPLLMIATRQVETGARTERRLSSSFFFLDLLPVT